jgi:hypothetical protein
VRIISMAWVWPAFVARRKTRTRREWKAHHAERVKVGEQFQVWDRLPRVKGASRIGVLQIAAPVIYEPISLMPDEDFEREGLAYMCETGLGLTPGEIIDFDGWRECGKSYWIIDFNILEVEASAIQRLANLLDYRRKSPVLQSW